MKTTASVTLEMAVAECPSCGCLFGIPPNKDASLRETKETFYCPSGHPQSYRESTSERLARELTAAQEKIEQVTKQSTARYEYAERLNKYNTELLSKLDACKEKKRTAKAK